MTDITVANDAIARPGKSKAESQNNRDTENLAAESGLQEVDSCFPDIDQDTENLAAESRGQPENSAGSGGGGLDLVEVFIQLEERKQQLKLLPELLNNPAVLSLKSAAIPCSTTPGEIEQRKRELEYRIDVLKALLEVTESELDMLSHAATEVIQVAK